MEEEEDHMGSELREEERARETGGSWLSSLSHVSVREGQDSAGWEEVEVRFLKKERDWEKLESSNGRASSIKNPRVGSC